MDLFREKRLTKLKKNAYLTGKHGELRDMKVEAIEFESLDLVKFLHFRMWMKIGTTFATKRLETMLPLAIMVTTCSVLLSEYAIFYSGFFVCSTVIEILTIMFFLPFIICAIHEAVRLNAALHETTTQLLLDWKRVLQQKQREELDAAYFKHAQGNLSGFWLRLNSYFQGLFNEVDNLIEQVDRTERPIALLGVRLTGDWVSRIIVMCSSSIVFGVFHYLRREQFMDVVVDQLGISLDKNN